MELSCYVPDNSPVEVTWFKGTVQISQENYTSGLINMSAPLFPGGDKIYNITVPKGSDYSCRVRSYGYLYNNISNYYSWTGLHYYISEKHMEQYLYQMLVLLCKKFVLK